MNNRKLFDVIGLVLFLVVLCYWIHSLMIRFGG